MFRFIFFIIFYLISNQIFSQSHISFGVSGVSHEDTLCIGDSIFFEFWLVNNSTSSLEDSISLNCETFDFLGASISSMQIGAMYNTNSSIDAGDSLFITIGEVVTLQSFSIGDNIIVIWPALIGVNTSDTSITNIHILDCTSSIDDFNILNNRLDIYYLKNGGVKIKSNEGVMSEFYIINTFGNIVYHHNNLTKSVSLKSLSTGIYIINTLINGKRIIKKIFIK